MIVPHVPNIQTLIVIVAFDPNCLIELINFLAATIHEESKANKILQAAGFTSDKKLVSFCNTGHWAATNWFVLSELSGLKGVKLYPESMVGWSNADLPMDNTPSLWQNLLDKF